MNTAYTKKLIISSIALSLVLGGGSLYAIKHSASAESIGTQAQQSSSDQQSNSDNTLHKHGRAGSNGDYAGKAFPVLDEAATILGSDRQTLEKSLQDGKSIVDIAKEKGISEADLTSKLLELRKSKIDEAVKSGKLDAAKAVKMKQRMEEHLKFMLNEKGLPIKNELHSRDFSSGLRPDFGKIAESLGITKEELKTDLKSGKSLTEIAAAKGISKEKLVNTIKAQLEPSIEQMVDRKKAANNK